MRSVIRYLSRWRAAGPLRWSEVTLVRIRSEGITMPLPLRCRGHVRLRTLALRVRRPELRPAFPATLAPQLDTEGEIMSWEEDIDALAEKGNERMDAEDYLGAVEFFDLAWTMLPEPKTQWPQATWLLASIGDAHVLRGDFQTAHAALTTCMHCPEALGNPFIHLRLGQAQFELGNEPRAADELMRAYMGAGPEIFADEDPKYIEFLASKATHIERPLS